MSEKGIEKPDPIIKSIERKNIINKDREKGPIKISRIIILIVIIGSVIAIPSVLFFVFHEEPYFIVIESDDDFERWCDIGNGTLNNPYIIEGHQITVPENWETMNGDYISPCSPSLIRISGVTKSFIIQNNVLAMKNKCGGNSMIQIYNVSVPFIIRDNQFSGYDKHGISISLINGFNSIVENNEFYHADITLWNSNNLSISQNKFHNTGYSSNYVRESNNITFQYNLFDSSDLEFYEGSDISLFNNTFQFQPNGVRTSISGYYTGYSDIVNNSFKYTGLYLVDSSCIPKHIEGNMVNGRPLGFFFNKSNLIIDNTIKYGQIILLDCNYTMISYQLINNTYYAILVGNCLNSTITNCSLNNNYIGAHVRSSNNTFIIENTFESCRYGVYGRYANELSIRKNHFISTYYPILTSYCTSVVDEENTIL